MTCKLEPVQSAPPVPTCIDANMPRCDPAASVFCTGPPSAAECRATTEGGYALASQEACTEAPGLECHPVGAGIHCVDSPKKSCAPASYPRCLDAGTILFCLGTPAAGYSVRTASCQSAQCLGAPGAARCQQG